MRYFSGCRKGCGGPRTRRGMEIQRENLRKGDDARMTHSMYSWKDKGFAPACDKCPVLETCDCGEAGARCKIVEQIREEVVANVSTQPHIKPLVHGGLIARLGTTRAKLWWCDLYLSIHGMMQVTGGGDADGARKLDVQPLVREQATLERQELALAQELGLTPMAEAKLRLDNSEAAGFDMAAALAKVHTEREARREGEDGGG